MKFWKQALLTTSVFFSICIAVLYTACTSDSCKDLHCQNGGSCTEGFCHCPTGFEGTQCETASSAKFIGRYYGTTSCDANQAVVDTTVIFLAADSFRVGIFRYTNLSDTIYGTANVGTIDVPEVDTGNYKKTVAITLDSKSLTFFTNNITDVSQGIKSTCTFTGTRK